MQTENNPNHELPVKENWSQPQITLIDIKEDTQLHKPFSGNGIIGIS